MENKEALLVKSALDLWNGRVKEANELISKLSDEQIQKEIAPGKNRGHYLLGHLTAVNDRMLPLLDFGTQKYAHYEEPFLKNPDKSAQLPSVSEIRSAWHDSVKTLENNFSKLAPADWFKKHTAVTEEDFKKEPHRNRLNVLLGRTTHLTYHVGQMALLK